MTASAESTVPRIRSLIARWAVALGCAVCVAPRARAQLPFLFEGLADGEAWATTRHSNLLTRHGGNPATLARLQLWGAVEPLRGLVLYGQGEAEGGSARPRTQVDRIYVDAEQYGARYTGWHGLTLDAGKLQPVIGTFAPRHFSNRNPLIGAPDAYGLEYPVGAVLSGAFKSVDFRGGAVRLPPTHAGYVPATTARLRPALGAGYTPVIGVRIGGSWTAGPYLNDDLAPAMLRGAPWTHYRQQVFALDAKASHGYLETFAEAARATFDVPGRDGAIMGFTYYGEAKYTFTPRFFLAARAERNAYPFIRASTTSWIARRVDFVNGEIGAGYRVMATTLLKLSLRGDRWWVPANAQGFLGQGGPAIALQVSQSMDLKELLTPRR
jgi:hypothetical protein